MKGKEVKKEKKKEKKEEKTSAPSDYQREKSSKQDFGANAAPKKK